MKTYTAKNQPHEQDNINFIDVANAKKDLPSFLDYNEVLEHSLSNGHIADEKNIKSLCDGGNHVQAYFSEERAAYECEMFVENTSFWTVDDDGDDIEKILDFDSEVEEYELF